LIACADLVNVTLLEPVISAEAAGRSPDASWASDTFDGVARA
jgi:hypothetical protein